MDMAFHIYHQVQSWLGSHLQSTEWGWKESQSVSITITQADAPEILLKIICLNETNVVEKL